MRYRRPRGFTLIEIMLVVLIIGIMSSLAIPYYQGMTARASRSEAQVIISKMRVYFINLYESTGSYATGNSPPLRTPSSINPPLSGIGQGSTWDPTLVDWKDLPFPPEGLIKMRYFYTVLAADQLVIEACGNFPGLGPTTQACGGTANVANYTYIEQYQGASQIGTSPIELPSM
jgi:prepilin-type N-terminal cleavage/methylation domain-containing protein